MTTSASLGQAVDDGAAVGLLQVDRDGALAAVPAVEAAQLAEGVALDRLDLDHVGAEVGEHHRPVRAGDVRREVDDLDAFERTPLTLPSPPLGERVG